MPSATRRARRQPPTFRPPQRGEELIRFEQLRVAFGPKRVLEELTLSVRAGETLTLIGRSGQGKSVLLKCLIGLLRPDSGRILFQGQDLTDFTEEDFLPVRRRVAMVFQGAALFDSLTVGENVAYPLREHFPGLSEEEVRARVAQKLELVNLPGTEALRPADLSGGMRKRVGLARAIAVDPEVILWDEPTTGLDPISTGVIDGLIVSMRERLGCTSVVVTHDMDTAFGVSDRIALLGEGRILLEGPPEALRASSHPELRRFLEARQPAHPREEVRA